MPAIVTHDQFGREALTKPYASFLSSKREQKAFRLGNQGPDPLFYCVANPSLASYGHLGSQMHHERPAAFLCALHRNLAHLPATAQPVARAWAAGFVCHYLLDRTAHPLVYAQERTLCAAGVDGLTERDGNEVHAIIESTIDEVVLFTRTGKTTAGLRPRCAAPRCDAQSLAAISYLVTLAVEDVYHLAVRPDLFAKSVRAFRAVDGLVFKSPSGRRRAVLGRIERVFRPHSFIQAMTPRDVRATSCEFDNHEHSAWENPFTHATSTDSFFDLFAQAQDEAARAVPLFLSDGFDEEAARSITRGLDFSGEPIEE